MNRLHFLNLKMNGFDHLIMLVAPAVTVRKHLLHHQCIKWQRHLQKNKCFFLSILLCCCYILCCCLCCCFHVRRCCYKWKWYHDWYINWATCTTSKIMVLFPLRLSEPWWARPRHCLTTSWLRVAFHQPTKGCTWAETGMNGSSSGFQWEACE